MDEKSIVPAPEKKYSGNDYDLYAVVAGTLGGSTLLMCMSFNMALYCLPIVPLILGIIALRKASASVDPQRTRNLAWLGIAGGGMGMLFLLAMIVLMVGYLLFFIAMFGIAIQAAPQR